MYQLFNEFVCMRPTLDETNLNFNHGLFQTVIAPLEVYLEWNTTQLHLLDVTTVM